MSDKELLLDTALRLLVHDMGRTGPAQYKRKAAAIAAKIGVPASALDALMLEVADRTLEDPWIDLPLRAGLTLLTIHIARLIHGGLLDHELEQRVPHYYCDNAWEHVPNLAAVIRVQPPFYFSEICRGDYATAWMVVNTYILNDGGATVTYDDSIAKVIEQKLADLRDAA